MSRAALIGAHGAAATLALLGFMMWEAEGAGIWIDAIFSFCG